MKQFAELLKSINKKVPNIEIMVVNYDDKVKDGVLSTINEMPQAWFTSEGIKKPWPQKPLGGKHISADSIPLGSYSAFKIDPSKTTLRSWKSGDDHHSIISAPTPKDTVGIVSSDYIKAGTITADKIVKPLPIPADIPVGLALDALLSNGVVVKNVITSYYSDEYPTITVELAVFGAKAKETLQAFHDWLIKSGKY